MKIDRDKIIYHFLLGPLGFRYRTIIAALVAALINGVLFPSNPYIFVIIMALYLAFGMSGIERKLILKWRQKSK